MRKISLSGFFIVHNQQCRVIFLDYLIQFGTRKLTNPHALKNELIINYPESEWAHVLLARGLIRLRRLDEAKVTLDRVIDKGLVSRPHLGNHQR